MSRPVHLGRRGGVYQVRFRLPRDLASAIGLVEIRRSLHTKDRRRAEAICLRATAWFRGEVYRLRMATNPTRADLERAAKAFFETLRAAMDTPRNFSPDYLDEEIAFSVEAAKDEISRYEDELRMNRFGHTTSEAAKEMLLAAGIDPSQLDNSALHHARLLGCRALRAQWEYYIQALLEPVARFESKDALFLEPASAFAQPMVATLATPAPMGPSFHEASERYLRMKQPTVGQSQLAEIARALEWLGEVIGGEAPLGAITKDQIRDFRDNLTHIDVTLRGRKRPFKDRLTNDPAKWIKTQSYTRYWKSVQAFFAWSTSEGFLQDDPAATLKIAARKADTVDSPDPFNQNELQKLFATPIFAGYKPPKHFLKFGDCRERAGHWWFPVLALHTGLRAGEISQLLPDDFDFLAPIPHIKVREVDADGKKVKQAKTKTSIRDVPIHQNLIDLGLADFVARQRKRDPKNRVFRVFLLGHRDRVSDGATRFWGRYLREFGLHKPGRATHVFRHTFAAALRDAGAIDEDIGALMGHAPTSITSSYGGGQTLARKAKTMSLLKFGFDVVGTLTQGLGNTCHS